MSGCVGCWGQGAGAAGPTGFCRDRLCPQPEGGAEGVVRPGSSLKGLFPLVRILPTAALCPPPPSPLSSLPTRGTGT